VKIADKFNKVSLVLIFLRGLQLIIWLINLKTSCFEMDNEMGRSYHALTEEKLDDTGASLERWATVS
jgi:hypothetical protein